MTRPMSSWLTIFDDDVGARCLQRFPAPVPVDADDQPEAAAPAGLHPGD